MYTGCSSFFFVQRDNKIFMRTKNTISFGLIKSNILAPDRNKGRKNNRPKSQYINHFFWRGEVYNDQSL